MAQAQCQALHEEVKRLLDQAQQYGDMQLRKAEGHVPVAQPLGSEANRKRKRHSPASSKFCSSRQFEEHLSAAGTPTQDLLPMLRGELLHHQLLGVRWLASLYHAGMSGVLADELQEDRQVQVVGLLSYLCSRGIWGPFLLAAPAASLPFWASQLSGMLGAGLLLHTLDGSQSSMESLPHVCSGPRGPTSGFTDSMCPPCTVVLCPLEMLVTERHALLQCGFKYVVLDTSTPAHAASHHASPLPSPSPHTHRGGSATVHTTLSTRTSCSGGGFLGDSAAGAGPALAMPGLPDPGGAFAAASAHAAAAAAAAGMHPGHQMVQGPRISGTGSIHSVHSCGGAGDACEEGCSACADDCYVPDQNAVPHQRPAKRCAHLGHGGVPKPPPRVSRQQSDQLHGQQQVHAGHLQHQSSDTLPHGLQLSLPAVPMQLPQQLQHQQSHGLAQWRNSLPQLQLPQQSQQGHWVLHSAVSQPLPFSACLGGQGTLSALPQLLQVVREILPGHASFAMLASPQALEAVPTGALLHLLPLLAPHFAHDIQAAVSGLEGALNTLVQASPGGVGGIAPPSPAGSLHQHAHSQQAAGPSQPLQHQHQQPFNPGAAWSDVHQRMQAMIGKFCLGRRAEDVDVSKRRDRATEINLYDIFASAD